MACKTNFSSSVDDDTRISNVGQWNYAPTQTTYLCKKYSPMPTNATLVLYCTDSGKLMSAASVLVADFTIVAIFPRTCATGRIMCIVFEMPG